MQKINDEERRRWVLHDKGLYNLYRDSGKSVRAFICDNRKLIDEVIETVVRISIRMSTSPRKRGEV